jgi:hypothetical protein
MQAGAVQLDAAVGQGSEEARLAVQLLMASGFPPPEAMPTLRDETIGTVHLRVHEVSGQGEGVGGTSTRVSGAIGLVTLGRSTLAIRALSTDGRATALQALRAYVPALVGLDGTAPTWRAGLVACPTGLARGMAEGLPANGLHRAALCSQGESKQVEVLESRLPLRNVADARAAGEFFLINLRSAITRVGGTAQMDEPVAIDGAGTHGWYMSVHATAANPAGGQVRIDQGIAVLSTETGHVELVASLTDADATVTRTLIDNTVTQLRLDGSAVTATAVSDGGSAASASAGAREPQAAPPPTFDPNAPLWQPPPNERPRATPPPVSKGPCGCRTVGADTRGTLNYALMLAVTAVLVRRSRRRVSA